MNREVEVVTLFLKYMYLFIDQESNQSKEHK
jgi:hypothetical protein